ncbi:CPBP family intramembrane glutamic endopeptidase [Nocardioides iriomotensis]|uniref:CPBP family intramembrane metalloprotease n=1 Tax=Nocardioides iriomotensis TaxID=715784 RepID=A0A4Q5IUC6_9ACTN|nr:type II CAAX endopeptidase family protein [Nocardioides iriomotensis]RYU09442.1 CPBP family intramembrane metalloprotease [Nocardioides iriomotensis]
MSNRTRTMLWSGWVILGFLLLPIGSGPWYFVAVAASGLALSLVPGALPSSRRLADPQDLFVIAGLFVAVVALNRAAFVGFTQDHVLGLFLCFAGALLLGVAGPVYYTVWVRHRTLADLGVRRDNLRAAVPFALGFAGVQFGLTLWGYDLPAPVDWVPLLAMSLVIGVFESVFFRGFIQTRLEEQLGPVVGIAVAAALYGAYHVGFEMTGTDLLFLTGLGLVYAVAFAIVRNLVVLWPLLTPLGSFYANLQGGDIELPWASIAGFADVLGLMVLVGWLALRHQRRAGSAQARVSHSL